jgi:hypothetical protein
MKMRIIQSRAASLDQVLTPKSGREKEQIRQQELEGAAASGYARLPAAVLTGGRGAESATFGRDRARATSTIEGSHEGLVEDRRAGEHEMQSGHDLTTCDGPFVQWKQSRR